MKQLLSLFIAALLAAAPAYADMPDQRPRPGQAVMTNRPNTFTANGTAATPAITFTGNPNTVGTNPIPFFLINPTAATPFSTWNAGGTLIGVDANGLTTGDVVDMRINNTAFSIDHADALFNGGTKSTNSTVSAQNKIFSPAFVSGNNTKFTTSGCSVSATIGGSSAGTYTSGTTGTCTVVITINGGFPIAATNGWACEATDRTTAADAKSTVQTASTTTTATLSGTTVSGDIVSFFCIGY